MANQPQNSGEDEAAAWGTWDELLLACAVKRHGLEAWDSVASEVQSRTSLPLPLTTPLLCELKYRDLQRRFTDDSGDKVEAAPWLDELRRRRVAELRQEVQRYDDSILSLQLKVKKLEDEREESLTEGHRQPEESKPPRRSDRGKLAAAVEAAGASAPEEAKPAAAEESDRENRSVNGSNSTGLKSEHEKAGRGGGGDDDPKGEDRARTGSGPEKASGSKPEGADSYNGSSEPNRERRGDESDELRDSVGQSKENSSDVQSSASLTRRKKGKGRRVNEISCDEEPEGGGKAAGTESQPLLVDILKLVTAHKHGSFFERRRLAIQESDEYHNIIRQHIDMDTIQSRLRKGSYSSSPLAFYRDLLLLFDNALVFYPKSSPESLTALDLHRLISSELRKKTAQTTTSTNSTQDHPPLRPKPELERSDSLLAKHKSSNPIIVCRKRSSFSAKPSPAAMSQKGEPPSDDKRAASDPKQQQQPQPSKEHQSLMKINTTAEKSVTGARSLRRSNTNLNKTGNAASPSSAPSPTATATATKKTAPLSSSDKTEAPRADQKKSEGPAASTKKRSAADFLKRIKRNSPAGKSKNTAVDSKNSKGGGGGSSVDQKKKQVGKGGGDKGEERASRQSGGNSGVKQAKEDSSPSKRSVGRPPKKGADANVVGGKRNRDTGGGKEAAAAALKQPRKRTRR